MRFSLSHYYFATLVITHMYSSLLLCLVSGRITLEGSVCFFFAPHMYDSNLPCKYMTVNCTQPPDKPKRIISEVANKCIEGWCAGSVRKSYIYLARIIRRVSHVRDARTRCSPAAKVQTFTSQLVMKRLISTGSFSFIPAINLAGHLQLTHPA